MPDAHFQTQTYALLVDNASGKSLNYRVFNARTATLLYALSNAKPVAPPAGSNGIGVGSHTGISVPHGTYLYVGISTPNTFNAGWYAYLDVA